MPHRVAAAAAVCLALAAVTAAQDSAPPAGERGVRELGPELYYLQNEAGRLVPVPGFRYRDFVELFRMREGLAGQLQPPAAVLDNLVVTVDLAAANGERPADACPVRVECTVRQTRGGWVAVPLDLRGVLLAAPPRHDGPGRMLVDAADAGQGYRGWFDAPVEPGAAAVHTLTFEGSIAVDAGAAQQAFELDLPPAVASVVRVRTDRRDPTVVVEPVTPGERITRAADGDGSVVSIAGLGGRVRIRVASPQAQAPARGAAAQAVTESIVRIDGRNAVVEATITLEHLPADTTRLSISLPPRMELREIRSGAALVSRGGTAEAPTVDVAVDVGPQRRAVVDLICEGPVALAGGPGRVDQVSCQPLGFAVAGIENWRQWGRTSLLVEGDWRVTWNESAARRVDPPATARQPGFVAAFAYDAQPAALALQVRPRESRMVVEPEYRYEVGGSRILLTARLRISSRGAPSGGIVLSLDDAWNVDEVGPAGDVDSAALVQERGRVSIPFAATFSGDTVVELRASRPIARDAEVVSWRVPMPVGDGTGSTLVVGAATVVVSSEDDIELVPDPGGITGLVRQTAAGALGEDAKGGLVYRLDLKSGAFAARRRYLPRRVEADIVARASLDSGEIVVEQSIELNVLHVPLEFIELNLPAGLVPPEAFEVRQDDERIEPTEVAVDPAAGDGRESLTCLRAILAEPLLGRGLVTVRYRMATPAVPAASSVAVDLPLALPVAATIERQVASAIAGRSLAVGVRGDAWRPDQAGTVARGTQTWSTARPQQRLPLTITARPTDAGRTMIVEAAWLRTRFLPEFRQDTWSYAISGAGERIVIDLPDAARDRSDQGCEVHLDGRPLPGAVRADGRVVIELPRDAADRRWRLDVATTRPRTDRWETVATRFGLPCVVGLDPPVFEGSVVERRFYWSLHLRPDEELFGMPVSWTSQQAWTPRSFGWRLRPLVTDGELAAWLDGGGALVPTATQPAARTAPPLAEKTYVYAGVGHPGQARPWIVPLWFVVLAGSGAALAGGLALVYRPVCRRTPALVAAVAVVGLACVRFPAVAPLVLQASLPGAALAVGAAALSGFGARVGRRPVAPPIAFSGSSLAYGAAPSASLVVTAAAGDATEPGRPR